MMDNFYEAEEFPDSEFEDLSQSQSLYESSGSEYQPDQDQESEQGSASLTMDSQVCAKLIYHLIIKSYHVCLSVCHENPEFPELVGMVQKGLGRSERVWMGVFFYADFPLTFRVM